MTRASGLNRRCFAKCCGHHHLRPRGRRSASKYAIARSAPLPRCSAEISTVNFPVSSVILVVTSPISLPRRIADHAMGSTLVRAIRRQTRKPDTPTPSAVQMPKRLTRQAPNFVPRRVGRHPRRQSSLNLPEPWNRRCRCSRITRFSFTQEHVRRSGIILGCRDVAAVVVSVVCSRETVIAPRSGRR
jgi:hypothetical protein